MIKELVLATNNTHKLEEVSKMLPPAIAIKSLADISYTDDIIESGITFSENAFIKAETVYNYCHKPVFADDSGLVVKALNGAPGVHSARYATSGMSSDNISLLLKNMKGKNSREAYFYCVLCLYLSPEKVYYFDGKINGTITETILGKNGFGYDPVFVPQNYNSTFAEISDEDKNKISHRASAIKKLVNFLNTIN